MESDRSGRVSWHNTERSIFKALVLILLFPRLYFCENLQTSYLESFGGESTQAGNKQTMVVSFPFLMLEHTHEQITHLVELLRA